MGLLSLLINNPLEFLLLVIPLLYSVIIHELAHGLVAFLFGDKTAKHAGRLSFNPLRHLDPLGTIMLFIAGFGWAKPVPVNYYSLKKHRFGIIAVALAGCAANFFFAVAAIFLLQLPLINTSASFSTVLAITARINIILCAFNLIPIPPLDGSRVLMNFLPEETQMNLARIEPYGIIIILFLLFTGLMHPVIDFSQKVIYSLISAIFK